MIKYFRAIALALTLTLGACASVGVSTPQEGVAACYYTVRTAFDTAADVKERGKLSQEDEKKVVDLGDRALAACDAARVAFEAGDTATAESKLQIANALLIQLEAWLAAQEGKS